MRERVDSETKGRQFMKHKSRDVTAAINPRVMPPTHYINTPGSVREQSGTPARARPVTPPTPASGFGESGIRSRQSPSSAFKLPEKVTQSDIRDNSFKYGGGRSAGNRSLADNANRRNNQQ
jgi:hypothetical protein